uniref:Carboxylic ester hydrolase n=1 Tax=Fusarium camptoceras TaxID=57143 RepID=A0A0Y0K7U2_9HYPO|nr:carboxylesterase [Fusarium camptoceras]
MSYRRENYHYAAGPLGYIEGLTVNTNDTPAVHYFGGLPYALPPTGQWRFRSPRKLPAGYTYGTASQPGQFTKGTWVCPQPPSSIPPSPSEVGEDCLQLNIWIPARPEPKDGWPVCFYIHGGFLQVGNANTPPEALVPLLSETAFGAIMVLPSYRLNAFGFLAGRELEAEASARGETVGNMGLWDQRLALEWTYDNIGNFGGNPANITVAGYSAGAYSTFQQLAHELFCEPEEKAVIRRIAMFSNGPGTEPKTPQDVQQQFDEFTTRLDIPLDLKDDVKLAKLREVPYEKMVEVQSEMKISEFRVMADGQFCPSHVMENINNGQFAAKMKSRGITLLNGECQEEHTMYRRWRTPSESFVSVHQRLSADFSPKVTEILMSHYCGPDKTLPQGNKTWREFFGRLYANVQVHLLERGFHNALVQGGLEPGKDILRYRIERRLKCVEEKIPLHLGVTHLTDIPIWLWGAGYQGGLTQEEKESLQGWNESLAQFVNGHEVNWGTVRANEMRRWRSDGKTDVVEDDLWENGIAFWTMVNSHKVGDFARVSGNL